jgi:threonine/homoserine/homoserine lactone efflux protein
MLATARMAPAGTLRSRSAPSEGWWATIGLNHASRALAHGVVGLGSFYVGHISADLVWYSAVSAAVASGRRICPPVVYRILFILCGVALIGLGAYFMGDGAARLRAM